MAAFFLFSNIADSSGKVMSHEPARSRPFDVTSRSVIAIAVPMTLAYSSTPLVGLVDTAVIGRLGDAALLGGIAIGAVIFDLLFTTFNFLRAGTTGLTAQALGADDIVEQRAVFLRAIALAVLVGLVVILFRDPFREFGLAVMSPGAEVEAAARRYIDIRIFATPFVLANYAILGWFLGPRPRRPTMRRSATRRASTSPRTSSRRRSFASSRWCAHRAGRRTTAGRRPPPRPRSARGAERPGRAR